MAAVLQKLLEELAKCQEDLNRVRQEAERVFYEADKLFRPWSREDMGCDSRSTTTREYCKTSSSHAMPDSFCTEHKIITSREDAKASNGTELKQPNIQESINVEALDRVLVMAAHARSVQAQHKAQHKHGKTLKQSTGSLSSNDGKTKLVPTKTTVGKPSRLSRHSDTASKQKLSTASSSVKTRTSGKLGLSGVRSNAMTRERGLVVSHIDVLKQKACTKVEKSEAQQTMMADSQLEKFVVDNTVGDRKTSSCVKTTETRLKCERQLCAAQEHSMPFNLLSEGCDLKIPGNYRRTALHAERLLENLQLSRDQDQSSADHFIQRLKMTFDLEEQVESRDCRCCVDLPTQISGQHDLVTSLTYTDVKELNHFLALQCDMMLLKLDTALCQIVHQDILPALAENTSDRGVVFDFRCVLQLLTPGLKMLPRAHMTKSTYWMKVPSDPD